MPRARTSRRGSRPETRAEFAALAARLRPKDWTRAGFRARAAHIALGLLQRGVDPATLDAWWPGGAENDDEGGVGPFARCWGHYAHLAKSTERAPGADNDTLQRAITDGITDQPATVVCEDGTARSVYPKALPVHFALTALDERMADVTCPPQTWATHALHWAWLVTHPTADGPFNVRLPLAGWPAPPDDLATLTPLDLVALVQAYHRVDRQAIALMCAAFPRQSGAPSRLGMAGFLGTVAKDRDVNTLSVKHIIATTLSEHVTGEEARARADQEAAAKRPAARR